MDLARRRGLRFAATAVTLLFALGGSDRLKMPALPMPEDAAARRGTEQCDDRPDDALRDVADFDRWRWRGMQVLVTTEHWTEDGDSGARATIVAARGALPAEVSWEWESEAGGMPGRPPLLQGAAVAASVLAEQTDEWVEARRYMGLEAPAKVRLRVIPGDTPTQSQLPQTLTA